MLDDYSSSNIEFNLEMKDFYNRGQQTSTMDQIQAFICLIYK